jgi:hypothetical protein
MYLIVCVHLHAGDQQALARAICEAHVLNTTDLKAKGPALFHQY